MAGVNSVKVSHKFDQTVFERLGLVCSLQTYLVPSIITRAFLPPLRGVLGVSRQKSKHNFSIPLVVIISVAF